MEETNFALGISLSIIAGIFLGIFAAPMKKITKWQWENTWLLYTLWACIILPWILALFTVPDLLKVYNNADMGTILIVFLFGAGWGIANIGFGIGVHTLGIALGTAIILGLNNALGAILPIVFYSPEELLSSTSIGIMIGVSIMLVGIAMCSIAGSRKDKVLKKNLASINQPTNFTKGLIICLIAGIFGAMFNFALVAGKPLEKIAIEMGASKLNAANSTWTISLFGGFLVTAAYCFYLLKKNNSLYLFKITRNRNNWILTFAMGIMWFGGVALYGRGVMNLGKLGASIGWPLIQSTAVASGSIIGIISGEWKGTGKQPISIMLGGLFFLLLGIIVISNFGQ
jgi:L-rhamnose-H+ transport protein